MVKGIVVQTRNTRNGDLHRVRSRSWVYVPEKNSNPSVIPTQGGTFKGEKKKNIFIAGDSGTYNIDTCKSYESVNRYAVKEKLAVPGYPSFLFKEMTALLWLMGRKAMLRKFLAFSYKKQIQYLQNPYFFYFNGHLDFHSAYVISERTQQPGSLAEKVYATSYHVVDEAYGNAQGSLSIAVVVEQVSRLLDVEEGDVSPVMEEVTKLPHHKIVFSYDRIYLSSVFYLSKKALMMLTDNPETLPIFSTDDDHIRSLMNHRYTILSGTAGTGKTTLLKKIASMSSRVILSATTGKAAKLLGSKAVTVHSLLGFGRKGFSVDTLDCDLLIVDEASMLNWHTLHAILKAAPRVVFSGDPGQLPPVEGESVFKIMTDVLPVVELTKKWRFANSGEPSVKVYHVDNEFSAMLLVKKIATTLKEHGKTFQVITPVHGGPLGTRRLNVFLQKIVNPQSESVFQEIKAHDKVIVTENVYVDGELIASNGQMGHVVSKDMGFIGLQFPSDGDGTVLIEPKDIKLAYALTVHKFQGSESDYVIFVIPPKTDREFLTDEMVFVGTTRGRKMTYVIDGLGVC
ncbi:MAG: AAA family ATPase [Proteobacteria bacterium]|nr:AAA family ATPase [Pseudomonadota bacterium]